MQVTEMVWVKAAGLSGLVERFEVSLVKRIYGHFESSVANS